MPKDELKRAIGEDQNFICPLSGEMIDPINRPDLLDTDRIAERAKDGGEYTRENTRIVTPRAHMERHGILRERDPWLDDLKAMMDSRQQTLKLQMKINNQMLARERGVDTLSDSDVLFLQEQLAPIASRVGVITRQVEKHMRKSEHPLAVAAMGVTGLGPVTVAGLLCYVDLEKAGSASAVWAYAGLHKSSDERYKKGEASGGNKTLRTIMWNCAVAMMKNKNCPYREVYDRTKTRLAASEKIAKSRNNQGKLVEVMWKDAMASHRHGAALRAVMKHVLADYWFVGRELAELDTRPLYVQEQLGHTGIIAPADRGWVW